MTASAAADRSAQLVRSCYPPFGPSLSLAVRGSVTKSCHFAMSFLPPNLTGYFRKSRSRHPRGRWVHLRPGNTVAAAARMLSDQRSQGNCACVVTTTVYSWRAYLKELRAAVKSLATTLPAAPSTRGTGAAASERRGAALAICMNTSSYRYQPGNACASEVPCPASVT